MPPDMEEVAADICMKAVMRYTIEEDIAEHVKLVRKIEGTFLDNLNTVHKTMLEL